MDRSFVTEHLSIPAEGKQLEAGCNDFTVINYGTEILYINDVHPLGVSDEAIISGHVNEVDKTVYRFKWGTTGGTKVAVIMRKKYTGK